MERHYCKWHSGRLGREMELLRFGSGGRPILVFPTSCGRFFDFEDRGMIAALAEPLDAEEFHLCCLDSVDAESWYDRGRTPRQRVDQHVAYEEYVLREVLPFLMHQQTYARRRTEHVGALGCSFGGYHAVNLALRHPHTITEAVSLCGAFDLSGFLDGYCDEACYLQLPTFYLPHLADLRYLERLKRNHLTLITGQDDPCLEQNRQMDWLLTEKGIGHGFHVWKTEHSHDWPAWQQMVVAGMVGRSEGLRD